MRCMVMLRGGSVVDDDLAVFIEGQDVTPVSLMSSDGEITCMMETELVELIEETGRKEGKTFDEVMIERLYRAYTLLGDPPPWNTGGGGR